MRLKTMIFFTFIVFLLSYDVTIGQTIQKSMLVKIFKQLPSVSDRYEIKKIKNEYRIFGSDNTSEIKVNEKQGFLEVKDPCLGGCDLTYTITLFKKTDGSYLVAFCSNESDGWSRQTELRFYDLINEKIVENKSINFPVHISDFFFNNETTRKSLAYLKSQKTDSFSPLCLEPLLPEIGTNVIVNLYDDNIKKENIENMEFPEQKRMKINLINLSQNIKFTKIITSFNPKKGNFEVTKKE